MLIQIPFFYPWPEPVLTTVAIHIGKGVWFNVNVINQLHDYDDDDLNQYFGDLEGHY